MFNPKLDKHKMRLNEEEAQELRLDGYNFLLEDQAFLLRKNCDYLNGRKKKRKTSRFDKMMDEAITFVRSKHE